ncbi:unnamed protein product [Urochloa humidicola]
MQWLPEPLQLRASSQRREAAHLRDITMDPPQHVAAVRCPCSPAAKERTRHYDEHQRDDPEACSRSAFAVTFAVIELQRRSE